MMSVTAWLAVVGSIIFWMSLLSLILLTIIEHRKIRCSIFGHGPYVKKGGVDGYWYWGCKRCGKYFGTHWPQDPDEVEQLR